MSNKDFGTSSVVVPQEGSETHIEDHLTKTKSDLVLAILSLAILLSKMVPLYLLNSILKHIGEGIKNYIII